MTTKFYGLTGGIGAGKSTVAHMFAQLEVPVLDLDKVGHTLIQSDHNIQKKLIKSFGAGILSNQSIDKKKLAKVAFSSDENTTRLNNIMHPAIYTYEATWRNQQTSKFAIIEASVLIESDGVKRMDGLIIVFSHIKLRKQRIIQHRKQSALIFESIIKQQCDDYKRNQFKHIPIYNNGSLEELQQQVKSIYKVLK